MKFGLSLPHIGKLASPDAIRSVAQQAEAIGYDSLWVLERTLVPVKPKIPYPATKDGMLPEDEYKQMEAMGVDHVILDLNFGGVEGDEAFDPVLKRV
jgi:alkanesulfonate monooxygenase SsuD/methylene tetrahydromethanopterin reductase-like flavin-dependent oxidoreductase (luciferase family)